MAFASCCLSFLLVPGCSSPEEDKVEAKRPRKSIFKQRTQEVGEFDPKAGKDVSDSKVKVTNPLLGGLEAYGPAAEKVTKLAIDHHLNIFNATHGRYPKDHAEFMQEIVKKNNLQLPKLPGGAKYEYDVANHKLVVIKGPGAK
tara:strand:- start:823 stop:1251 length:429 start_codon:yes stop_codon:yes gene_type:complete